jgi:hypothetical protein
MLSYYVQLREHMRSSINCSARREHEPYPQQDQRHLFSGVTPPKHLRESTVPRTATQDDPMPAGPVELDDAFEAMTDEMNFDWPEVSPVGRIKAGVIQSTLGLVLFLVLIAAFGFLHQGFLHQP